MCSYLRVCCSYVQDRKAALAEAGLHIAERVTELETVLKDDLLRQQEELQHRLSSADVEADRYPSLCADIADDDQSVLDVTLAFLLAILHVGCYGRS